MRVSNRWLSLVSALGVWASSGAAAADVGDVQVTLKSGAIYGGMLVEKIPGDHVTLKLATGEVKRIEWADIDDRAAPAPTVPAPPSAAADPGAWVTIESENPHLVLERQTGTAQALVYSANGSAMAYTEFWEKSCSGTCRANVNRSSIYRINGEGVITSREFHLTDDSPAFNLRVHTGSYGSYVAGTWLILGGSIAGITGGSLLILPLVSKSERGLLAPALVVLGVGVVAFVAGVVLRSLNGTDVIVEPAQTVSDARGWVKVTPTGLAF